MSKCKCLPLRCKCLSLRCKFLRCQMCRTVECRSMTDVLPECICNACQIVKDLDIVLHSTIRIIYGGKKGFRFKYGKYVFKINDENLTLPKYALEMAKTGIIDKTFNGRFIICYEARMMQRFLQLHLPSDLVIEIMKLMFE